MKSPDYHFNAQPVAGSRSDEKKNKDYSNVKKLAGFKLLGLRLLRTLILEPKIKENYTVLLFF